MNHSHCHWEISEMVLWVSLSCLYLSFMYQKIVSCPCAVSFTHKLLSTDHTPWIILIGNKTVIQWWQNVFWHLEFSLWLNNIANKSCKFECCGNKMHQNVQNMRLAPGLELNLSLSWRTIISGQHPLFYRWIQKVKSVWTSASFMF